MIPQFSIFAYPGLPDWEEAYLETEQRTNGDWIKVEDLESFLNDLELTHEQITLQELRSLLLGE